MLNIIVSGGTGRVGQLIIDQIKKSSDLAVAGIADVTTPLASVIGNANVVIDFTVAAAAAGNAVVAAEHGTPIVIGTTGLSREELSAIKEASKKIPIVHAPNMSLGVNVLYHLIGTAARTLPADYRIEILETHHTKKLDRPSGTAKKMLEVVMDARGASEKDVATFEEALPTGTHPIEVASFRKDDVVGDHVIRFIGPEEILEVHHDARSREVFARGALTAARWIVGKPAGIYSMSDVLGLTLN